jgi:hypothetical protein
VFSLEFSGKKKGRADVARPGEVKRWVVPTSYGGMTRVRFEGSFPRVENLGFANVKLPCLEEYYFAAALEVKALASRRRGKIWRVHQAAL